jgi:hypothetical protein
LSSCASRFGFDGQVAGEGLEERCVLPLVFGPEGGGELGGERFHPGEAEGTDARRKAISGISGAATKFVKEGSAKEWIFHRLNLTLCDALREAQK